MHVLTELTSSNFLLNEEVCSRANIPNGIKAAFFKLLKKIQFSTLHVYLSLNKKVQVQCNLNIEGL